MCWSKKNISTPDEFHSNCDCNDGFVLNGVREPTLFNFVLGKLPGYKVYESLEQFATTMKNICVFNSIKLYLEASSERRPQKKLFTVEKCCHSL